jgi:hypothetical protein
MPNTTTKTERAQRIKHAQALLIAAGWSLDQPATGIIVDELVRKYNYVDYRSALRLEAKAARLLRGEALSAMSEPGRPRTSLTLRGGDAVEVLTIAAGEAIDASRYTATVEPDGAMRLTSDERDDLILRRIGNVE